MIRKILLLSFQICFSLGLFGQLVIQTERFDYNGGALPPDWSTVSLFDNGPSPAPGQALWQSQQVGVADGGAYWGSRSPIASPTGFSGAMVFDSDFYDSGGVPGSNNCNGTACAPHSGALLSPVYDFSNQTGISIRFYQYLRSSNCRTLVGVTNDGGQNWTDIPVNEAVNNRPFGGETDPFSTVELNLTPWAAGQGQVQFRFIFEGAYFFWIIDDLEILADVGPDMGVEFIDWPKAEPTYSCLLGDEEEVRIRIKNNSTQTFTNFPVYYQLDFGPIVTETFTEPLPPNSSMEYTFSTPANLTPDPAAGHFLEAGVNLPNDPNQNNNQTVLEIAPCQLRQDSLGGVYRDRYLIVQFAPGTTPLQKDTVRNLFEANVVESCACDSLELWELSFPLNVNGQIITNSEESRNRVKDEAEVEDSDLDYILDNALPPAIAGPGTFNGGGGNDADSVVVAIIDTGLDFDHDSLEGGFWTNEFELANPYSPDDDANCYDYDHWGYHFIEPTLVPADDHSHGTHVGGLVLKNMPDSVNTALMSLKVQAENGKGTLFHAICAIYYAGDNGADILNLSLGFYGERPTVMDSALVRVGRWHDVLVVTSAGNDSVLVDTVPHWPSGFSTYKHIISVTAVDGNDMMAPFSNYGDLIDIAAPGTNLLSTVPGGLLEEKSGTSMAAAVVTRAAVLYKSCMPSATGAEIKAEILAQADVIPGLFPFVAGGRRLNSIDSVYLPCFTTPIEEELTVLGLQVYPNPFDNQFAISWEQMEATEMVFELRDLQGRLVFVQSQWYGPGTHQLRIEPGSLSSGLYLWQVRIGDRASSGKLSKY